MRAEMTTADPEGNNTIDPPVGNKIRERVFRRDNYECQWCGASEERLRLDFITPLDEGGERAMRNLRTVCVPCYTNHPRQNVGPEVDVPPRLLRRNRRKRLVQDAATPRRISAELIYHAVFHIIPRYAIFIGALAALGDGELLLGLGGVAIGGLVWYLTLKKWGYIGNTSYREVGDSPWQYGDDKGEMGAEFRR